MTSKKPAISVILCTWNRPADLLQTAVDSILQQTFTDLELIVVDDGSTETDPAQALATRIKQDQRLQLMRQDNKGLAAARNTGIAAAKADLIALQDDDDLSLPERLQAQHDFLRQHREIGAVSCGHESSHSPSEAPDGESVLVQPPNTELNRPDDFCDIILANASVLIRRSALEAVGGWRECFRIHEDLDLSLRLQEKCSLARLPQNYYRYCPGATNRMTRSPVSWQYYCAIIASAWLRRNSGEDSLADSGELSLDELFALTKQTPSWLRRHFIWQARKLLKYAMRNGESPTVRLTLEKCSQFGDDLASRLLLWRLRLRLLLWYFWYGAPAHPLHSK